MTGFADAMALVESMSAVGSSTTWLLRFSPLQRVGSRPSTCNRRPWDHLKPGARAQLRQALGRVLAQRVARRQPPVPVMPPRGHSGCGMCGVSAQPISAAEVAQLDGQAAASARVWSPVRVDGRDGVLCRPCRTAVERTGSGIGASANEAAVSTYLKRTNNVEGQRRFRHALLGIAAPDLQPWIATGAAQPNDRPWQHAGWVRANLDG